MSSKFNIPCPTIVYSKEFLEICMPEDEDKCISRIIQIYQSNPNCFNNLFENDYFPLKTFPLQITFNNRIDVNNFIEIWGKYLSYIDDDDLLPRLQINDQKVPFITIFTRNDEQETNSSKINDIISYVLDKFKFLIQEQKDKSIQLVKDLTSDVEFAKEYNIILNYKFIFNSTKSFYTYAYSLILRDKFNEETRSKIENIYRTIVYNICHFLIFKIIPSSSNYSENICLIDGTSILTDNPFIAVLFFICFSIRSFFYKKEYQPEEILTHFSQKYIDFFLNSFDIDRKDSEEPFFLLHANEFDNKRNHNFEYWEPNQNMTVTTLYRIKSVLKLKSDHQFEQINRIIGEIRELECKQSKTKEDISQINEYRRSIESIKSSLLELWNQTTFSSYDDDATNFLHDKNYDLYIKDPKASILQQFDKTNGGVVIIRSSEIDAARATSIIPVQPKSNAITQKILNDDDDDEEPEIIKKTSFPTCSSSKLNFKDKKTTKKDVVKITPKDLESGKISLPKSSSSNNTNLNLTDSLLNTIIQRIEERIKIIVKEENEKLYTRFNDLLESYIENDLNNIQNAFSTISIGTDNTPLGLMLSAAKRRSKRDRKQTQRLIDDMPDLSTDHDEDDDTTEGKSDEEDIEQSDQSYSDGDEDDNNEESDDPNLIDEEEVIQLIKTQNNAKPVITTKKIKPYLNPDDIYSKDNILTIRKSTLIIQNYNVYDFIKADIDEEKISVAEEKKKMLIIESLTCLMKSLCLSNSSGCTVIPHGFMGINFYVAFDEEDDNTFKIDEDSDQYNIDLMLQFAALREFIFNNQHDRIAVNRYIDNLKNSKLQSFIESITYQEDLLREIGLCSECRSLGDTTFKEKSDQYIQDTESGKIPKEDPDYSPFMDYQNYIDIKSNLPEPFPKVEFDESMEYCLNCNNGFHFKTRKGRKRYILLTPQFSHLKDKTWRLMFENDYQTKLDIVCEIPLVDSQNNNGEAFCGRECSQRFKDYNLKLRRFIQFQQQQQSNKK